MNFLITAGATREYLDPVRFISNASTGRMGHALAIAAVQAGHKATLITGGGALAAPAGVNTVAVETSRQMFDAVKRRFSRCDCLIMAAAVCDWTPARKSPVKIKKTAGAFVMEFKPTDDILAWAGRHKKPGRLVVGFALEDRNLRHNAEKKLQEKKLDMIVANTPVTIGSETATVQIKIAGSKNWIRLPMAKKTAIAGKIITLLEGECRGATGFPGLPA